MGCLGAKSSFARFSHLRSAKENGPYPIFFFGEANTLYAYYTSK